MGDKKKNNLFEEFYLSNEKTQLNTIIAHTDYIEILASLQENLSTMKQRVLFCNNELEISCLKRRKTSYSSFVYIETIEKYKEVIPSLKTRRFPMRERTKVFKDGRKGKEYFVEPTLVIVDVSILYKDDKGSVEIDNYLDELFSYSIEVWCKEDFYHKICKFYKKKFFIITDPNELFRMDLGYHANKLGMLIGDQALADRDYVQRSNPLGIISRINKHVWKQDLGFGHVEFYLDREFKIWVVQSSQYLN